MSDTIKSTDSSNQGEPDEWYTYVIPRCPVCGSTDRAGSHEEVPHSFTDHYVHARCEDCGTSYQIEYRAIDVSWATPAGEPRSGVENGCVTTTDAPYRERPSADTDLPDTETLQSFDWPLYCHCEEQLTGNHVISEDIDQADLNATGDNHGGDVAVFECPNCDDRVALSPK